MSKQVVYVAIWDVHNQGGGCSVHATESSAVKALLEGLTPKQKREAREDFESQGYWQDSEDDPRICLNVEMKEVQP